MRSRDARYSSHRAPRATRGRGLPELDARSLGTTQVARPIKVREAKKEGFTERARSACARPTRAVRATQPSTLVCEWKDGALDEAL